jgi:hypothetical protein
MLLLLLLLLLPPLVVVIVVVVVVVLLLLFLCHIMGNDISWTTKGITNVAEVAVVSWAIIAQCDPRLLSQQ